MNWGNWRKGKCIDKRNERLCESAVFHLSPVWSSIDPLRTGCQRRMRSHTTGMSRGDKHDHRYCWQQRPSRWRWPWTNWWEEKSKMSKEWGGKAHADRGGGSENMGGVMFPRVHSLLFQRSPLFWYPLKEDQSRVLMHASQTWLHSTVAHSITFGGSSVPGARY